MSSRSKTPGSQAASKPAPKIRKQSTPVSTSLGETDLQKELKECKAEVICLRAKFNPAEIEKYKIQTVTTEQMFQDALIKAEKDLKAYEAGQSDSPILKELREKLYSKEKEAAKLKNAAKYDAEEMTILKRRCKALETELMQLKAKHEIATKELATKDEKRLMEMGYRQHLAELKQKLATTEDTLKTYTNKLPDIFAKRYDAETLGKELSSTKAENESLRQQMSSLQKRFAAKDKECSEFEHGHQSLTEKLRKLEEENENLRSSNAKLQETVTQQKSGMGNCTKQSADTEAYISKLEKEIKSAEKESDELRHNVKNLALELKQTEANYELASRAKEKLQHEHEKLQTEAEHLRKDAKEHSDILHERDVELDQLHVKLTELGNSDMYRSVDGRISSSDQAMSSLQRECRDLQAKLETEKNAHAKTKSDKEELEMKCHDAFEKISQKEKKLAQQETNHKQLIDRKDSTIKELRREKTIVDPYGSSRPDQQTLEATHKKTLDQLEELKKDNNDLKSRLSKIMGSHVLDNNSNIADLSDPYSPERLVERLSQIYDNEWTDIFECCEIEYGSTKESVNKLFSVLIDINTFCQTHAVKLTKKIFDTLHSISNSKQRFDESQIPPLRLQKLRELTKWFAPDLTDTVIKEYQANNRTALHRKDVADQYIQRCVEVCWFMSVQTPPVVLEMNRSPGSFDESLYRPYTKTGKTVDFVVWPPVRICENGRLICKGIAQGHGK